MVNGKKLVIVLPAYNAAKTLEITYNEIPTADTAAIRNLVTKKHSNSMPILSLCCTPIINIHQN